MPSRRETRNHVVLDRPVEHRVLRLVGDERIEAEVALDPARVLELVGGPLGDADVEHLPRGHEVVESAQRLLDGRVRIGAVALVEVDVIDAQPPQGALALLDHVLARETGVVRALPHREEDLGGQHVVVAVDPVQRPAHHLLGLAAPVHVRGVEEVDPELEGPVDAGRGRIVLDRSAVGQPRAEADLGHAQAACPQMPVAHASETSWRPSAARRPRCSPRCSARPRPAARRCRSSR